MCGEWSSGCVRRFWRVDGSASAAARANGTLYGDGSGVPDGHAGELLQWAEVPWAEVLWAAVVLVGAVGEPSAGLPKRPLLRRGERRSMER